MPLFSPALGGLGWPRGRDRGLGVKVSSLGGRLGRLDLGVGGGGLEVLEG